MDKSKKDKKEKKAVEEMEEKEEKVEEMVKEGKEEKEEKEEKCPKCGSPVEEAVTRAGKHFKKCSTNVWNPETRTSSGCDYIEWPKGTTEQLDEDCPKCGAKLVIYTTAGGKRMKKCSTNSWNRETRTSEGCDFIQWL